VRDWLVNLESAIPAATGQRAKDDSWIVRIVVDEVSGGGSAGITLVRGRQIHCDDEQEVIDDVAVQVILAGEGSGSGLQRGSKAEVGERVGIKGPVWEVLLEGQKWGVGVDWKVLA
jgi:hypothetical protein